MKTRRKVAPFLTPLGAARAARSADWLNIDMWENPSFDSSGSRQLVGTQATVRFHYCSRNLWATYGEHMGSPCGPHMFPIRSPYVRHMGKISKTTKSYVAHMLSNIWGNLWATQQHMGNIWGNVVIFAFKLALRNIWETYGEHMGNIWETYGEHTQSNTQQNLSLPLLMQHPQGQSGFHQVCFESLFIINKDGRMNSGSTARADEILT